MKSYSSQNGTSPILELRGITKSFSGTTVLRDVDFKAFPSRVHAIVGENGAGKSTLVKIAAGVHLPDSGTILINEKPVQFHRPIDAIRHGVAMIYQELNLAPHLTVEENIFLGREPGLFSLLLDRRDARRKANHIIREHGFDLRPQDKVLYLSAGQKQLVEIVKALAAQSSILIMDEPTSSLSEKETAELMQIIRDLCEHGVTIIYISHRLEEVLSIADTVMVLRDGEKVADGGKSKTDIPTVVRQMVGRELTDFYPDRRSKIGDVCLEVSRFTRKPDFENVSFDVRSGEIVGMAGLVGAGRTEVAETIFGAQTAQSGTVKVDETPLKIRSPRHAVSAGIGLLTEDRKRTGLCFGLRSSWNITLANLRELCRASVLRLSRERKVAEDFIERLSISGASPDRKAELLSGGNQQKLAIARWLFRKSRVLIFDEPTRGIDVGAKREVYQLMNSLADEGKAILFISSELPELLGMCDRILVMFRGRIVAKLDAKSTDQEEIMHYAAVGRAEGKPET